MLFDIFSGFKNKIEVGNKASLSLFNPNEKSTFTKEDILSKSKNSAFLGQNLQYSVI